jgi:hypothetical protein
MRMAFSPTVLVTTLSIILMMAVMMMTSRATIAQVIILMILEIAGTNLSINLEQYYHMSDFQLVLGLWAVQSEASRACYSKLREALRLLRHPEVERLPLKLDTLKRNLFR